MHLRESREFRIDVRVRDGPGKATFKKIKKVMVLATYRVMSFEIWTTKIEENTI